MDGFALITITILAVFLGFEVVSKVSSTLHTPLMSEANAIHGIILLGAILVAGQAEDPLALALSTLAVLFATINVVGGFVVTDRMLLMFTAKRGDTAKRGGPAKRGDTAKGGDTAKRGDTANPKAAVERAKARSATDRADAGKKEVGA
jgi:H+-translocating NAD(P) transhydrogenase subunit alpha